MSQIVEEDTGTFTGRSHHAHNGYYAGDFSAVPFRPPDLGSLLPSTRPSGHLTGATR